MLAQRSYQINLAATGNGLLLGAQGNRPNRDPSSSFYTISALAEPPDDGRTNHIGPSGRLDCDTRNPDNHVGSPLATMDMTDARPPRVANH